MASVPQKRSALHHVHLARHARMVDESGWQLPAAYTTVDQEVESVRKGAGLTDTSPLGKIDLRGPDAHAFLRSIFTRGVPNPVGTMDRLPEGELTGLGGSLCARLSSDHYYMVTHAAALDAALAALGEALAKHPGETHLLDMTSAFASVTLAGPRRRDLLYKLTGFNLSAFPDMGCSQTGIAGVHCRLLHARGAYHVHAPREFGEFLYDALIEAGEEFGATLFGSEAWTRLNAE